MSGGLTAAAILRAWEVGATRRPVDRALAMLWAAGPESDDDLWALPLAERDRRLLALRQATFGDTLPCVTACPQCAMRLELQLSAEQVSAALRTPARETVERDGTAVALRALDSRDLAAAAAIADPEAAAALLRARCCELGGGADEAGFDALPKTLRSEIETRIEAREGAGEIRLSLGCEACAAQWEETLDVAQFVWLEIEIASRRLFGEVAELAALLGWSEADILAMSDLRRSAYLQLARGG